jgi:peroxiredoxin
VSLHRFAGYPTILVFYPVAFEPVSREQLTLYQEYMAQFEDFDAQLLGISADHAWCHEAFAQETGVRFPLLADVPPRGAVSQLYGVYREQQEVSARALLVIDREGVIRFSEVYPDLLNPGVDDLLTELETLHAEESSSQHQKIWTIPENYREKKSP